jgi:hypothetical protein
MESTHAGMQPSVGCFWKMTCTAERGLPPRSECACGKLLQAVNGHALCEATDGAWNDDLDTMCTERCDDPRETPNPS